MSPQPPQTTAAPATTTTTGALAAAISAELLGPADIAITGLDTLDRAGPGTLTFIRNDKYAPAWASSKAVAAIVTRGVEVPGHDPARRALLIVENADIALAAILALFAPPSYAPPAGIHPTAVVDPTATIAPTAAIGPTCVIGPGAAVGDGAILHAGVYLGAAARVGARTVLHPGVRILDRCTVGDHCTLWPGVIVGADGFGYVPAPGGRGLVKIPHIGHVQIGHHVEIGANTCIDRGKFGATSIGDGTKIDNLVQIGHNCTIGRSVIIAGHAGIAGSVTIGDGAIIAGHVGIADNLTIGPRATLTAKAGLMNSIPAGQVWGGYPARPHLEFMRTTAAILRLPEHLREHARAQKRAAAAGDGETVRR